MSPKLCRLWTGLPLPRLQARAVSEHSKSNRVINAWLFLSTDSFPPPPGPRRRLETEQSQPVSGEQSAAPTPRQRQTRGWRGGPGGARWGCHGPGPAARAAAFRGAPAVMSGACLEKGHGSVAGTLVPWTATSAQPGSRLGRRHVPARACRCPTPSRVLKGPPRLPEPRSLGLDGAGTRTPEPCTPYLKGLRMSRTTYCWTSMTTPDACSTMSWQRRGRWGDGVGEISQKPASVTLTTVLCTELGLF